MTARVDVGVGRKSTQGVSCDRPHENLVRASLVADARWRPEVFCSGSAFLWSDIGRIGLHAAESRCDSADRPRS